MLSRTGSAALGCTRLVLKMILFLFWDQLREIESFYAAYFLGYGDLISLWTSWQQLKVRTDNLSGAKISVNHRGCITENGS